MLYIYIKKKYRYVRYLHTQKRLGTNSYVPCLKPPTHNDRDKKPSLYKCRTTCIWHCFAASRSKPASLYTHGNPKWQQSCSHSTAICNHRFKKRIELCTQEQPLVAEHRGGTDWPRNDPNRTRPTQEVPFIAGCSHLTQKNAKFCAPASSPKQSPCNIHAAITMHFAAAPSSPFPFVTISLRHRFPSSPLPFVTTSLPHHFPS